MIVEDGSADNRRVFLVGRRSLDGLDLEDLWGPFRSVVSNWFEELSRNIDALMKTANPRASVIDELARQWHLNLYVREPEEVTLSGANASIDGIAIAYYERAVGESVSLSNLHKRTAPRDMVPA